ncbi:hypothetical protein FALCPG4_005286 [Fusarium falciforme]
MLPITVRLLLDRPIPMEAIELGRFTLGPTSTPNSQPAFQVDASPPPQTPRDPHSVSHNQQLNPQEAWR